MTISRWKVMAGILGVSIGGLAAIAGQSPKSENKARRADESPVAVEAPKVPSGGSKPAAPAVPPIDLTLPAPADTPPPPITPTTKAAPKPLELPAPVTNPVKVEALPVVPLPADTGSPTSKKPVTPKHEVPAKLEVIPVSGTLPPAPPSGAIPGSPALSAPALPPIDPVKPSAPVVPSLATEPVKGAAQPESAPGVITPVGKPAGKPIADPLIAPVAEPGFQAPSSSVSPPTPSRMDPAAATAPARATAISTTTAAAAQSKFRIILRVGEGEPMFEVRSGDDLVMKVACEKVDIKSPEKGSGLSAVTATGKVRFVGFGAEGTCDSFSFLAGTGEVSMSGNVRVQVKDKIGRVESELTTEKMQYRLDSTAMPGMLKP